VQACGAPRRSFHLYCARLRGWWRAVLTHGVRVFRRHVCRWLWPHAWCRTHSWRWCTDSAKFYMCEIFVALKYLHHVRLTAFRDLKPENLLIDASGHVVLVDFGFAVQLNGYVRLPSGINHAAELT